MNGQNQYTSGGGSFTYDASGTMLRRYVQGTGVDDPTIWYEGAGRSASAIRYMLADRQGVIVLAFDGNFSRVAMKEYDEYGIPAASNIGRFQYTGQAYLLELGMYHYKARIYSPTLGRFLQTDPIGYDDQVNLYAYVGNDPVNNTDPTGLEGEDDTKKRIVDVVVGTAKVVAGAVLTAVGVAGDGASGAAEVGTAGVATPVAVPAAVASTAVAASGIAMAADGAAQIMRSTPAGSNGGESNGGGNSGNGNLSGHAQDRMRQRDVSPERVQEAQQIGRVKPGNSPDTVVREVPSAASESGRGVRIVMDRATGRVITVIDKGSKFK